MSALIGAWGKMLGNFSYFCSCLLTFFKIIFSKNSFRNTIRESSHLDPDQDLHFVGPNLLIWFQTVCKGYQLMTIATASKQRVKIQYFEYLEK